MDADADADDDSGGGGWTSCISYVRLSSDPSTPSSLPPLWLDLPGDDDDDDDGEGLTDKVLPSRS